MNLNPRLSLALFCLFFSGILCAQVSVPVLSKFQSIEVLQSSLFKGELQLGPGLQITGPAIFTDPVKLSNVPTLTGTTEGVLAVDNTGVIKNMPMMLLAEELEKTEVLQNVASFHVSTLAEFAGQVMFKPGTMITGSANFIHAVAVEGSFTAAGAVSFTGLDQTDTWNYLLTADESGTIQKATATSIAMNLHNTGIFSLHDELTVTNVATLGGEVVLPEGTQITGQASFANGVNITGDLGVAGHVAFTGIAENSMATGATHVLVLNANGTIESTPLPNFGPLLDGVGDGGLDDLPCGDEPQPARWKYEDNIIYTNNCTPDVKVGIGTELPQEKLHIMGKARIGGLSEYINIGHDGSHNIIESYAPNNSQANNPHLHINYNTGNGVIIGGNTDISNTSFLKVGGNTFVRDRFAVGTFDQNQSRFNIAPGNMLAVGANGFQLNADNASIFLGDNNHYLRATHGKGVSLGTLGAENGIFLAQDGNVGIGTGLNSPSAKLHIKADNTSDALVLIENSAGQQFKVSSAGQVYTRKVNITLESPFPDYVFQSDYKLMGLSELETYIKTNGKLPGMPSAKEVAAEGVEIGELTRVLTEKVEELTLHIIALQKRIEELEKKSK